MIWQCLGMGSGKYLGKVWTWLGNGLGKVWAGFGKGFWQGLGKVWSGFGQGFRERFLQGFKEEFGQGLDRNFEGNITLGLFMKPILFTYDQLNHSLEPSLQDGLAICWCL